MPSAAWRTNQPLPILFLVMIKRRQSRLRAKRRRSNSVDHELETIASGKISLSIWMSFKTLPRLAWPTFSASYCLSDSSRWPRARYSISSPCTSSPALLHSIHREGCGVLGSEHRAVVLIDAARLSCWAVRLQRKTGRGVAAPIKKNGAAMIAPPFFEKFLRDVQSKK